MIAIHSLVAYSGKNKSINALIAQAQAIEQLSEHAEICGSDKLIGDLGVVVDGKCTGAYKSDCWSEVCTTGRRVASNNATFRKNVADINEQFCSDDEYCNFYRNSSVGITQKTAIECSNSTERYCEFFMSSNTVLAVVVSKKASAKTLKQARVIARAMNVFVTFEKSYTSVVEQFNAAYVDESLQHDSLDSLYAIQEQLEFA